MPDLSLGFLALIPLAAVELAKAARWASLLGPRRPAYGHCLQALVSGQMANLLSPLRAGEAVQLGFLTLRGGGFAPAAATLVGVKVLDAVVLLVLASSILGAATVGTSAAWVLVGAVALCTCVAVALMGGGGQVQLALLRLPFAQRVGVGHLQDVAMALHNQRVLLVVALTSGLVWCAGMLANSIVLAAVGIQPTFDLAARVLVAGYAVGVLPAPPGRVGVFEAGVALVLVAAGVQPVAAVTAGVALHVLQLAELALLIVASVVVPRWSR